MYHMCIFFIRITVIQSYYDRCEICNEAETVTFSIEIEKYQKINNTDNDRMKDGLEEKMGRHAGI